MKYLALQSTFKKVIIIVKLLSLFNNLAVLFWLTDIWEVWKGCEVSRQHVVFCISCRAQINLFFGWWPDMMFGQRKLYSVLSRNWLVKILGKNLINPCVIFWLTFIFFTKGQNLRFTGEDLAMGNVRRIHDLRLSPPQKPLCIVGTAGEKEKESARGTIHTPRAFYFSITAIFTGIPSGIPSGILCGGESDFRTKKETGAEIFPAVVSGLHDRTTRRQRNRRFKNEFAFFRSLSRLF